MTSRPDLSGSRAVLLGVGTFSDAGFLPLPAALNSLAGMNRILTDPDLGGWPADQVTVMADPGNAGLVARDFRELVRQVRDVLVVYYVGHGAVTVKGTLCLVVSDTVQDAPDYTGIDYEWVKQALRESPARIKIMIIDCCYAGQAIEAQAADDTTFADLTHVAGVYTLTATTRNQVAHVVPLEEQGSAYTSFTGQLLDIVESGIPDGPQGLTLADIYPHLQQRLGALGLPRPNQRGIGTADRYPFARNAAHRPDREPDPSERGSGSRSARTRSGTAARSRRPTSVEGGGWEDQDWDRLVDQIRSGDCTPFLGDGAGRPTLPTGDDLARRWADHYRYPFEGGASLHEVMQYASITQGDAVTVKRALARDLVAHGEPDFADPAEPHTVLAGYPIRVYLTTMYDDFMTRALERAGKRPVTAVCPWFRDAEADPQTTIPGNYQPRSDEPLVYHLHGSLRADASLVLTDQDHIEFLVAVARDLGLGDRRIVPDQLLYALTRQPLLFVGFSLRDRTFRMLLHGLVEGVADVRRRRHVSVQLSPEQDPDPDARRRAMEYLTAYATELNLSIYWGEAGDFFGELAHRLRTAAP